MRWIKLGQSKLKVPTIGLGCMRMGSLSAKEAQAAIGAAVDSGINFFDHADIYGAGRSEEIFADATKALSIPRERLLLQSKCGIRKDMYDFSREHILTSVEGILRRLKTDYLDLLLLHRPDALAEPEVVAEVFDQLYIQGKVRYFGVSNHSPMQMKLLYSALNQPITVNQLQFSITNATMVSSGLNVNTEHPLALDRDGGVLDYCRLNKITIQPWSPLQFGFFEGVFLGHEKYPALNAKIDEIAARYGVSNTTIAIAWILRHPAEMQPIVGTMNPERIAAIARASEIMLTREEWYQIYLAAGNRLP